MIVFLVIGVLWLVLAALVGVLAESWGRSGLLYFMVSVLTSPLLGLVLVLAVGKKQAASKTQFRLECPKCNTLMDPNVNHCPGCGVKVVGVKK